MIHNDAAGDKECLDCDVSWQFGSVLGSLNSLQLLTSYSQCCRLLLTAATAASTGNNYRARLGVHKESVWEVAIELTYEDMALFHLLQQKP